ncbi:MAG: alpha/beta hydrolase [Terriglobales bacterium]
MSAPSAATPLLQSLSDTRYKGVTEDWTTPGLLTSNLRAVRPVGLVDDTHPGYTVELLQVQWRWNDALDLYVMKPQGVKKPPVILYLFGYPQDTDIFKTPDFQRAVTKNGFAAVCFVSALTGQRYHDRPMREWFLSELQESLGKSAHDVQMVLNYLASRGDLDLNRVGMFGQKSGASIAILASAVDPRIKVLDVLDPWGDWPAWMATSPFVPEEERPNYLKPEFLKKASTLEPVDWLPKVQAKKFRFQDAVFEVNTPKTCKEKLRAAAPARTTFVLYKGESEFSAAFPNNSLNLGWMERELRMPLESMSSPESFK